MSLEMSFIKPPDLLKSSEKLAGLVDINLARLLSVSLAKCLVDTQSVEASPEDAALAAEILRTAQAENLCNLHL